MSQFDEPWTVDSLGRGILGQQGWILAPSPHGVFCKEVLDRIAACVNACEGLSNQEVAELAAKRAPASPQSIP